MLRRLLLLAVALGGLAQAAAPPRIDLEVTPAWKGWSRPGRSSEIDVRLTADSAVQSTLDVAAGSHSVHTDIELQPGRPVRLQIPIGAVDRVEVTVAAPETPAQHRDLRIAQSESPVLGVALATADRVEFDGFHTIALAADDLPRNVSAYASVDALILDAATLGVLEKRQLEALLAHVAGCGRLIVLHADSRVRAVLESARACGGPTLLTAESIADAKRQLDASLATALPPPVSQDDMGTLGQSVQIVWRWVAVGLAVYFAAALLAVTFVSSFPALVVAPVLAIGTILTLLYSLNAPSELAIWSESTSGAKLARYQSWQRFPGLTRNRVEVPVPTQLAQAAQPCGPNPAVHFAFDATHGRPTSAAFETRLFRQVSLCYSGAFPITRAIASNVRADGGLDVRNVGTTAWPPGILLAAGRVHALPAVDPGARAVLEDRSGLVPEDRALRTAMMRVRPDTVAALWALDLGGIADLPVGSRGWLLVSTARP